MVSVRGTCLCWRDARDQRAPSTSSWWRAYAMWRLKTFYSHTSLTLMEQALKQTRQRTRVYWETIKSCRKGNLYRDWTITWYKVSIQRFLKIATYIVVHLSRAWLKTQINEMKPQNRTLPISTPYRFPRTPFVAFYLTLFVSLVT